MPADPVAPHTVFMACRSGDEGCDPLSNDDGPPSRPMKSVSERNAEYRAAVAGRVVTYETTVPDAVLAEAFELTETTVEGSARRPSRGACWIELPEALTRLTSLPGSVWGTIEYTADDPARIRAIHVEGLDGFVVGGTTGLEAVRDVVLTADGVFYATATLPDEPCSGEASSLTLPVQFMYCPSWPCPGEPDDDENRHQCEVQYPLGDGTMACRRWFVGEAGVEGSKQWLVYLYGDRARSVDITAVDGRHATDGLAATLCAGLPDVGPPGVAVPFWRVVSGVVSVRQRSNPLLQNLVDDREPVELRVHSTGALQFLLNDGWDCYLYDSSVDYVHRFHGERDGRSSRGSLHLLYALTSTTEGAFTGSEAAGACLVEGENIDVGAVRFERLLGGIELSAKLRARTENDAGQSPIGSRRADTKALVHGGGGSGLAMAAANSAADEPWRSDRYDGSSAGFAVQGFGRMSWDGGTDAVTALFDLGVAWTYRAAQGEWYRTVDLDLLTTYEALPEQPEADGSFEVAMSDDVVQTLGVRLHVTWDDLPRRPARRVATSVFGDFRLPDEWGMVGQQPTVSAVIAWTRETFDHGKPGGPPPGELLQRRTVLECSAMSDFTFHLAGQRPAAPPEGPPVAESGFGVDLLRYTREWAVPVNGPARTATTMTLSGVANYEDWYWSFVGFGRTETDRPTEWQLAVDADVPLVDGDHCRFSRLLLSRIDGAWSLGLTLAARSKREHPWATCTFLPVKASKKNWSMTAFVDDFRISDDLVLEDAYIRFGKKPAADGSDASVWDWGVGGAVGFEDIEALADLDLRLGLYYDWGLRRGGFYVLNEDPRPRFGSGQLDMSFKQLSGEYVGASKMLDQDRELDLSLGFDLRLPWLKADWMDGSGPVDFTVAYRHVWADDGGTGTNELSCKATGLPKFPFQKGKALPVGGGLSFDELSLAKMTGGWAWTGQATLYTDEVWRKTLSDVGGTSPVGVSLPTSATARVTAQGLGPPVEVVATFAEKVGLKIGEFGTLGIESYYWRKASPWAPAAGAVLESADKATRLAGTVTRDAVSGVFRFVPSPPGAFDLSLGDVTVNLADFVLEFQPRTAPRAPTAFTFIGRAAVAGGPYDGVSGDVTLTVATDGSVQLSVLGVAGLAGVASGTSLSVTATKERGTWKFEAALETELELPGEVPLVGGRRFRGLLSGSPQGAFQFTVAGLAGESVTTAPQDILTVDVLGGGTTLTFQSLSFGRTAGRTVQVGGSGVLRLGRPVNAFLGLPGDVPFVSPPMTVSYANGKLMVEARPGADGREPTYTMPLAALGTATMTLRRLYFDSSPKLGLEGRFVLAGGPLDCSVDYRVDYDVATRSSSFMLVFDDALDFATPAGKVTVRRAGFTTLVLSFMGIDADFSFELGNAVCGFGGRVDKLWWLSPATAPPIGYPFFDEVALDMSVIGFGVGCSVSNPRPSTPDAAFLLALMGALETAFADDRWQTVKDLLRDNRSRLDEIFPGPALGKAVLYLPDVLSPFLPELEVVSSRVPFVGTIRRLKLPLTHGMLRAADVAAATGVDVVDALVDSLKTVKDLMGAFSEPKKLMALVPENGREGSVKFKILGFASFAVNYEFADDKVVTAAEDSPGVKEFFRFHRLATHVERTYPRLVDIAAKRAAPAKADFAHVSDEGWAYRGRVTDTACNLKEVMQQAIAVKAAVNVDGPDFDEVASFTRHVEYLDARSPRFTPSTTLGEDCIWATLAGGRRTSIRIYGMSHPFTFADRKTGHVYFREGALPFYGRYSVVFPRGGTPPTGGMDAVEGLDTEAGDRLLAQKDELGRQIAELGVRRSDTNERVRDARVTEARRGDELAEATKAYEKAVAAHEALVVEHETWRITRSDEIEAAFQRAVDEARRTRLYGGGNVFAFAGAVMAADEQRKASLNTLEVEDLRDWKKKLETAAEAETQAQATRTRAEELLAAVTTELDRLTAEMARLDDATAKSKARLAALEDYIGSLNVVLVTSRVEMRQGSLVLVTDASIRELQSQQVLYQADDIADQPIYDWEKRSFDPTMAVMGWTVGHGLDDRGLGTASFTDYGTMKIEAPHTVVTWQFRGSKLNQLRDPLEMAQRLPIFGRDATPLLLATHVWASLQAGSLPVLRRSVSGDTVRFVMDKEATRSAERNAALSRGDDEAGAATLDVALRLEDVRVDDDLGGTGLSLRSDVSRYYRQGDYLLARPFPITIMSANPSDTVTRTVSDLLVLDGSKPIQELLGLRSTFARLRMPSPVQLFAKWGLNFAGQRMSIRRAVVDIVDGHLATHCRPNLVTVTNLRTGVEMVRIAARDRSMLDHLLKYGPYDDPAPYPAREERYFVDCRARAGETKLQTDGDASLVSFFEQDLLLREVDLQQPVSLVRCDPWQGRTFENHTEARGDGMWQGGLPVAGKGIHRFVQHGERILFTMATPSGKRVRVSRRFNGSYDVAVERETGNWVTASFERDSVEALTGGVRYPTGEIVPGGFFIDGVLDMNVARCRGAIAFGGRISTDGDFHFEGDCTVTVLEQKLGSARFIVDRGDGVYLMGDFTTGIATVHVEGRVQQDEFSLTGVLDARTADGRTGVSASITLNTRGMRVVGTVYLGGSRLYYGTLYISGSSVTVEWSLSCGRLSASADLRFSSSGGGRYWQVKFDGKVKIKLWDPFGTHSHSFDCDVDTRGRISVGFWKIKVIVDLRDFDLDWEWD